MVSDCLAERNTNVWRIVHTLEVSGDCPAGPGELPAAKRKGTVPNLYREVAPYPAIFLIDRECLLRLGL
jgi:hypothetical protein